MRQDPFHRPGGKPDSLSRVSPWWIGLALVLAMLFYFRSMGFLFGRWFERHTNSAQTGSFLHRR